MINVSIIMLIDLVSDYSNNWEFLFHECFSVGKRKTTTLDTDALGAINEFLTSRGVPALHGY